MKMEDQDETSQTDLTSSALMRVRLSGHIEFNSEPAKFSGRPGDFLFFNFLFCECLCVIVVPASSPPSPVD